MKRTILFSFCLVLGSLTVLFIDSDVIKSYVYAQVNTKPPIEKKVENKDQTIENENQAKKEKPVQQQKNLPFFNSVNITGSGNLYVKQGDKSQFTVEAEQALLSSINAYVKDQTLYLDFKSPTDQTDTNINYYLTIKDLQKINSYVASSIVIEDPFETENFQVSLLGGFGDAKLNLKVNNFIAKIKGAGKIMVKGSALNQNLDIQGVGEYSGSMLQGENAIVNISGSGVAKINSKNTLKITLTGDGIVEYCGKPEIEKNISGKGQIKTLSSSECH